MLRSLVGSEMCIRDSINAEYGGDPQDAFMLTLRSALLVAALALSLTLAPASSATEAYDPEPGGILEDSNQLVGGENAQGSSPNQQPDDEPEQDDNAQPAIPNEPDNEPQRSQDKALPVLKPEEPASREAEVDEDSDLAANGSVGSWPWMLALLLLGAIGACWLMTGGKSRNRSGILVTGPSMAGKTQLFYTLKDGGVVTGTTVSMKENEATFRIHKFANEESDPVHMIDYPGEPQLSSRLADFFPVTKAIVFMIDSHDKASIEQYAAEAMYNLLTNPVIAENAPPILVVCNKSDYPLASKCALLQKLMEEELTKLKQTRSVDANLDHDDTESEVIPLGPEGVEFKFDQAPCPVRFVRCSLTSGEGLEAVADFCMEDH
eukprot:TRINITY_DN10857_c0_g3_i1.p1 TRINITY_DN10857_c0_g3~~TRINITY_DN10857_c0_g3_i1.p1  ORF type:complete len:430 (-),score=98.75 TRINITY_DN10857_c0_g3_i1:168-1301(-)